MKPNQKISYERLKEVLEYNPETGSWIWLVTLSPNAVAGSSAGSISVLGYRVMSVDRVHYTSARLAWFYMTGAWPAKQIDHRDCNKSNNKWSNLREASGSQNGANCRAQRNNRHKLKGVSLSGNKFLSRIMKDGKRLHLGYFATAGDAHKAHAAASMRIFGEFSRAA